MAERDRNTRVSIRRWGRACSLFLAVAIAMSVTGCSSGNAASPTSTAAIEQSASTTTSSTASTVTTTSSTTTPVSVPGGQSTEDEIIARYVAYWDARFAANSGTPNPDDPALREFATGEQLNNVIAETRANLEQGLAFRPAAHPADIQQIKVIDVDGDHAAVQECVISDGVVIRRATGEVVNDDVTTHNVRGDMVRVDGVWRLESARLIQQWNGVAGCALDS